MDGVTYEGLRGRQAMYRPHRRRSEALRPAWVRLIKEVDPSQPEPVQVRGPQDAVNLFRERAARELIEVFYVIALNSQSRVIAIQEVTRGSSIPPWCIPAKCFGSPSPSARQASSSLITTPAATPRPVRTTAPSRANWSTLGASWTF